MLTVARIVEAHGASIRVDDAAGGGAMFTIKFPLPRDVMTGDGKRRDLAKEPLAAKIQ